MNHNLLPEHSPLSKFPSRGFWIVIRNTSIVLVVLGISFGGGVYLWAQTYNGVLPPRSSISGLAVGGQSPEYVQQHLQQRLDTIVTEGIEVISENQRGRLPLMNQSATDTSEDIDIGLEESLQQLMDRHKPHPLWNAVAMFGALLNPPTITLPVTLQTGRIQTNIRALFPYQEQSYKPASFLFTQHKDTWTVELAEGVAGTEFDWEDFFNTLEFQLSQLSTQPITLHLTSITPRSFSETETSEITNSALLAIESAPYVITYQEQTWNLDPETLALFLAPSDDATLTFEDESLVLWMDTFTPQINQAPRDARITIENGRVVEFVESVEGRSVDTEQLTTDLLERISTLQPQPIELVVQTVSPTITTGDVNDLGIDEVLGVGTSSYAGSPINRRKNIQNGVDLLNGLLIPPGETFSLLKALSPFTFENGYLPELVIKGDKIEPEIGGGLCQIGTTTFRATMNAGLLVKDRRNHSLTVSYYNDPSNGNPGTDATIYDPAPDYTFVNDTDHYVLLQAENLTDIQELKFTFWGTSDGRKGSYTPPVVSRWIPVGETRYIETTDLAPGVEQCQGSHIGADASFTYRVEQPSGEVTEHVFTSHYRPLPRICLIGVEPVSEESETDTSSEEPTTQDLESTP